MAGGEAFGVGGLMQAIVHCDGVTLYQTSSVRYFDFCSLSINRPNMDDQQLIATDGPHFDVHLPNGFGRCLSGAAATFEASGFGTLGAVSFVAGAAARDGWEAYGINRVAAAWELADEGISASLRITLGEPNLASFSYQPPSRSGVNYVIEIDIPAIDLALFYMARDVRFENLQKSVEARFGRTISESMKAYV
jgi:hypothetical protein